jgi:hypothetical protein
MLAHRVLQQFAARLFEAILSWVRISTSSARRCISAMSRRCCSSGSGRASGRTAWAKRAST